MTKRALAKILKFSEENPGLLFLCQQVHDEILVLVRGEVKLDDSNYEFENGILKPKWIISDEGKEVVEHCKSLMEETEADMFGGSWLGRSEYGMGKYWDH